MSCEHCGKQLRGPNDKPPRPDKRFCSRDCRYAFWDAQYPRINRGRAEPSKATPRPSASRTTLSRPRRTRRENGTRVYLLADEIQALAEADVLTPPWMRGLDKLVKAKKRLEARS